MPNKDHSEALQEANQALAKCDRRQGDRRPVYHFTPPCGWMNDPNGLIQYKGLYHMFYQHNPYDTAWALMHWGHAVSPDLVRWTDLPIALAPSESYDLAARGGCYSGSALEVGDEMQLMYTGCVHLPDGEYQTQNLARSRDGIHFEKEAGNPVIAQPPPGGSEHFRDPKTWQQGDMFYSVLCNSMDGRGCVQLYRSPDLINWDYRGALLTAEPGQGWMWECPDFFPLDGRWVLTYSAMGTAGDTNVWLVGDFDYETERFTPLKRGSLDCGRDFYAAQTFLDDSNRRILIAWAGQRSLREGVPADAKTAVSGFCGQMTLPRALSLAEDDALRFAPIPELQALRGDHQQEKELWVDEEPVFLSRQEPACCELLLQISLENSKAKDILLECSYGENQYILLTFDRQKGVLSLDRREADEVTCGIDTCPLGSPEKLTLHLFLDRNSVEVFIQGGEQVLSANIFPSLNEVEFWLYSSGESFLCKSWDLWSLKS